MSMFSYIWEIKKRQILIVVALIIVILIIKISPLSLHDLIGKWSSEIDPIIGFITLMVAGFIWLQDIRKEWLNSLPKLLTVRYVLEGKMVMLCKYAGLTDESDMRNWAQQIGLQMNGKNKLEFNPSIRHVVAKHPIKWKNRLHKMHFVQINLNEYPLKDDPEVQKQFQDAKYIYWDASNDEKKYKQVFRNCPEELVPLEKSNEIY